MQTDTATATPPARKARPRRLGAPERRQQLVATAQRLFGERGYRATTMEDIAHAAGVTKPLLYQHFASKRALYLELVQQVSSELLGALRSAHARANSRRELVENGYRAYFETIVTHAEAFRLLFGRHAPDEPELLGAVRAVEREVLEVVASRIPEALGADQRRLLAYALIGLAEGGARYWVDSSRRGATSPEEVEQLASRISALAWSGLQGLEVS
jgi:AcrR family transcriptional regulator